MIAISASPVIDKSKAAAALEQRHGFKVVDDPTPAICRSHGFQTLYEVPSDLQQQMRLQVINDHISALDSKTQSIFTFSLVELLADWMRWAWSATPTETWAKVLARAEQGVSRYDRIVHLSEGPAKPYDGYVWFDRENARQQDRLMRMLYTDLGLTSRVEFDPRF